MGKNKNSKSCRVSFTMETAQQVSLRIHYILNSVKMSAHGDLRRHQDVCVLCPSRQGNGASKGTPSCLVFTTGFQAGRKWRAIFLFHEKCPKANTARNTSVLLKGLFCLKVPTTWRIPLGGTGRLGLGPCRASPGNPRILGPWKQLPDAHNMPLGNRLINSYVPLLSSQYAHSLGIILRGNWWPFWKNIEEYKDLRLP